MDSRSGEGRRLTATPVWARNTLDAVEKPHFNFQPARAAAQEAF